jgi:hypothetical protein
VAAAYLGGGVVGGGQFAAGDDEVAAAEVVFGVPVGEVVEDAEELLAGRGVAVQVPGQALLRAGGEAIEVGGDEAVLVAVVGVEGRLGGVGLGGDPVDADGVDPLGVEELTGDLEDALGRGGRLRTRKPQSCIPKPSKISGVARSMRATRVLDCLAALKWSSQPRRRPGVRRSHASRRAGSASSRL